jgi:acylglycerol lipase
LKTEGSFKNKDAQNIIYTAFLPERAKAVIVFVHGLGEHSAKYDYFGEIAYEKGMAYFAYDQRGHGRSGGHRCHVDTFDDFVEDLRQFVGIAKIESLCDEVFIVGHSMGGLTALIFSMKYGDRIKGTIVSAPVLRLVKPPGGIEEGIVGLLSNLTTPNRIPFEYLSHDRKLIEETENDKYSQRAISFKLFIEMKGAMRYALENAATIKVPVLLLHGTGDKVIEVSGTVDFYDKVIFGDKEIKLYDGLYHELLRETERREIIDYILGWIAGRTGRTV